MGLTYEQRIDLSKLLGWEWDVRKELWRDKAGELVENKHEDYNEQLVGFSEFPNDDESMQSLNAWIRADTDYHSRSCELWFSETNCSCKLLHGGAVISFTKTRMRRDAIILSLLTAIKQRGK